MSWKIHELFKEENTEIRELFGPYLKYYGAIHKATTEEKWSKQI